MPHLAVLLQTVFHLSSQHNILEIISPIPHNCKFLQVPILCCSASQFTVDQVYVDHYVTPEHMICAAKARAHKFERVKLCKPFRSSTPLTSTTATIFASASLQSKVLSERKVLAPTSNNNIPGPAAKRQSQRQWQKLDPQPLQLRLLQPLATRMHPPLGLILRKSRQS